MTDSEATTNALKVRQPQHLEHVVPLPPASAEDAERAARVLLSLRGLSPQD